MRFTKTIIAASLFATALSLAGCYDHHPGQWGDHHHHHDHDHDHDGNWH